MSSEHSQLFDKCKSYIHAHAAGARREETQPAPVVTISREAGAGGTSVALRLVALLQEGHPDPERPWTVFNRDLVRQVLEDHALPDTLAALVREDARLDIEATIEEILGLHPSAWTMVEYTAQTILRLARLGRVVVVGRAAHVITRRLKQAFHVRLVAPLEMRVRHVAEVHGIDTRAARRWVEETDRARRRYAYRFFGVHLEDASEYHLTVNTGLLGFDGAARLIDGEVRRRYP